MRDLQERGFTVLEAWSRADAEAVSRAYDQAFARAPKARIKRGSTTTRLTGLVAAEPFHLIYLDARLRQLALERLGGAFKLSSFCARTLRPHTSASALHQDVKPGADGDPLLAFIFMVDAFTPENGATRFVAGSRHMRERLVDAVEHQACGPAGSLLIFDGATWHEHGANRTDQPRRSIQGAFVRADHTAAVCWRDELSPEQAEALPAQAQELLNL